MRLRGGLFLVSALLFVAGVSLIVMAAASARTPPVSSEPPVVPVASVRQIMRGMVDPAADIVFGAVSTTVTAAGTEEKAPRTPDEWDAVVNSAAALAEAGNLLLVGTRRVDDREWVRWARSLSTSSTIALRAAEARDAKGVFDSGEAIYLACDGCHRIYERTE